MKKVLLLTGPSGAGKTTTSEEFLKAVSGTWAYINQDEIRQQIKAGYESAGDYEYNWNDETRNQWEVSIPICTDMVKRYIDHDINCVVDVFAPPEEIEKWRSYLQGLEYTLVVLLPNEDTTLRRNSGRSERSRLKDNKILQNHKKFLEWRERDDVLVIDTTSRTVQSVVSQLLEL